MASQPPASLYSEYFEVIPGKESFGASLKARKGFRAGTRICPLDGFTRGPKRYTTVQYGKNDHMELNSDLVYVNHSCEPNAFFDVSSPNASKWRFCASKDIQEGEELTFFYPSTEWEMDQPFDCNCGNKTCLGKISGASNYSRTELSGRGFINSHIWELVEMRDSHDGLRRISSKL